MNVIRLVIVGALLAPAEKARSQEPDWVAARGVSRAHPPGEFLTGYHFVHGLDADALKGAVDGARSALSETIRVRVASRSQVVSRLADGDVVRELSHSVRSRSLLHLFGLQAPLSHTSGGKTHALASMSIKDGQRIYLAQRRSCLAALGRYSEAAERAEEAGDANGAAALWSAWLLARQKLVDADVVLLALGGDLPPAHGVRLQRATIEARIARLERRTLHSMDALVASLAARLRRQAPEFRGRVLVTNPTWRDTQATSAFGRLLSSALITELIRSSEWDAVPQRIARGTEIDAALGQARRQSAIAVVLWDLWDDVGTDGVLHVVMRDVEHGEAIASARLRFPSRIALERGMAMRPPRHEAIARVTKAALAAPTTDVMRFDLWTDKGKSGVVYQDNETMTLSVLLSTPGFVRVLYQLSDGHWTPLVKHRQVRHNETGRPIRLRPSFRPTPPFGAEFLLGIASTEPLPKLSTRSHSVDVPGNKTETYEVLDDDLLSRLPSRTRGMKAEHLVGAYPAGTMVRELPIITTAAPNNSSLQKKP